MVSDYLISDQTDICSYLIHLAREVELKIYTGIENDLISSCSDIIKNKQKIAGGIKVFILFIHLLKHSFGVKSK